MIDQVRILETKALLRYPAYTPRRALEVWLQVIREVAQVGYLRNNCELASTNCELLCTPFQLRLRLNWRQQNHDKASRLYDYAWSG